MQHDEREVRRVRDEALTKLKGSLRAVYRTLELPGKNPLKVAYAALDTAVLAAYGFSPKDRLNAERMMTLFLISMLPFLEANPHRNDP